MTDAMLHCTKASLVIHKLHEKRCKQRNPNLQQIQIPVILCIYKQKQKQTQIFL